MIRSLCALYAMLPSLALLSSTSGLFSSSPPPCVPSATQQCPEADPDLFLKDQETIYTNIEFLLWNVNESYLDYAVKMDQPSWFPTGTSFAVGKYKNATFGWDPGVRVALGYFNAFNYWDVFAQYTFLHAEGTDTVHAPSESDQFLNGTTIGPDFNSTSTASPLKKAHSQIDLYYNVVDGIFSRRFHPNPHFRLNLFGGLTAAFIHQSWNVRDTNTNNQVSKIKNQWSFSGAGPRIGIKVDWFMRCDFYLTGQVSNAILSGNYKNRAFQNTNAEIAGTDNTLPFHDTHFKDFRLVYTVQFFAGPSWQKVFKKMRTELFAGYEFTVWNNLHEIYRSNRTGATAGKETYINSSLLGLQGVTLRWTLDF